MFATAATVIALAGAVDLADSRHLWSTVNVCDTADNPDTIGLRASMPGTGRKGQTMWMRFRVQFRARRGETRTWSTPPGAGGDSGFVRIGHARYKARQSGWLFPFELTPGRVYRMRGVVTFEWRRGSRVAERVTEVTSADHNVSVSDPEGHSEASCLLSG